MELDTMPAHGARARADQRVLTLLHPHADPRGLGLVYQPGLVEVPEQVAAEDALRQGRLARSDREMRLVRSGELLGDLVARVTPADDQHGTFGKRVRGPVG